MNDELFSCVKVQEQGKCTQVLVTYKNGEEDCPDISDILNNQLKLYVITGYEDPMQHGPIDVALAKSRIHAVELFEQHYGNRIVHAEELQEHPVTVPFCILSQAE